MAVLDGLFNRLGLVTLPPANPTTVTWDFVQEQDVVMPRQCAGDPAHEGVAVERKVPGKRSKSVKGEGESPGCGRWLVTVVALFFGWIVILGRPGQQTVTLTFNRTVPYCAACDRGRRRANLFLTLAFLLIFLSCLLLFILPAVLPSEQAMLWLLPLALGILFAIGAILIGVAQRRSHAVRILDFEPLVGSTQVTLRFHNPAYAALFTLENSIAALEKDPRPSARQAAARWLGSDGDYRATLPLVAALGDQDDAVRQAAVEALIRLNDPAAQGPLVSALSSGNAPTRLAAATVLKERPMEERAAEALTNALAGDDSPEVRLAATQALAAAGGIAVPSLRTALQDGEVRVRVQAARSLQSLTAGQAVPDLISALGDPASEVRQACAQALGALGNPQAIDPLIHTLGDPSPQVRQNAAQSLIALAPHESLAQALHALIAGTPEERATAAGQLGEIGDARALPALRRALHDGEPVRQSAARALVRYGPDPALEPLLEALQEAESGVQATAAGALGELGDPRAEQPLLQALQAGPPELQPEMAAALARCSSPSFHPVAQSLHELLTAPPEQRQQSARRLSELGDPRAAPVLSQVLLRDDAASVRTEAARALPRLGVEAIDLLIGALDGFYAEKVIEVLVHLGSAAAGPLGEAARRTVSRAQRNAFEALGRIEDARAVEVLVELLGAEQPACRLEAVQQLRGRTGSSGVLPALLRSLQDTDRRVREAAAVVLGESGDARAVAPLVQALDDASIRSKVLQALQQLGDLATEALLERCQGEKDRELRRLIGELLGDQKPSGLGGRLFRRGRD